MRLCDTSQGSRRSSSHSFIRKARRGVDRRKPFDVVSRRVVVRDTPPAASAQSPKRGANSAIDAPSRSTLKATTPASAVRSPMAARAGQ